MGKNKASITVADVSNSELDREFQQQQIITHLHEFHETVTLMSVCQDDLQHHLTDLQPTIAKMTVNRARQEKFQQTVIRELCTLKTLPPSQNRSQIPIRLLAKPLTDLLHKDSFQWSLTADQALGAFKVAMTSTPILAIPDFTKSFTIECDASDSGIGAILSQESHPIEFLSKPLAPKHHALSVYDREMLAVVFAQKWLLKLLGYNYALEYRPGSSKAAADALFRRPEVLALMGLSRLLFDCITDIQATTLRTRRLPPF
nr:uncharacterized protein LOC114822500 [Malus domestica]